MLRSVKNSKRNPWKAQTTFTAVTYCRGFTPAKQQQPDLCPISVAQQLAENNQQKVDALKYAKLFQTQTVQ